MATEFPFPPLPGSTRVTILVTEWTSSNGCELNQCRHVIVATRAHAEFLEPRIPTPLHAGPPPWNSQVLDSTCSKSHGNISIVTYRWRVGDTVVRKGLCRRCGGGPGAEGHATEGGRERENRGARVCGAAMEEEEWERRGGGGGDGHGEGRERGRGWGRSSSRLPRWVLEDLCFAIAAYYPIRGAFALEPLQLCYFQSEVSSFLQGKLGRVSSPLALVSKKIMNDLFRKEDHGIGYYCDFR